METQTKWPIVSIVIAIIILLILIILFYATKQPEIEYPQSPEELEECHTLKYHSPDGINIVYFAPDDVAQRYVDFFLDTPPFNKYKDAFNFFNIAGYEPDCEIYKGVAILCHSRRNTRKAASCPNDFVYIIKDEDKSLRSSAYLGFVTLNSQHSLTVQTHESGHALANFAEEYINNQPPPQGSENCVKDCTKFNGLENGCFQGCSQNTYFRSINNGVMKTLSSNEYGDYNEILMQEAILDLASTRALLSGFQIKEDDYNCEDQKYYLAEIESEDLKENEAKGKLKEDKQKEKKENKITKHKGCPGRNGRGPYRYKSLDDDKKEIYSGNFNPEKIYTISSDHEDNREIFDADKPVLLKIPDLPEEEHTLEIQNPQGEILTTLELYKAGAELCKI